MLTSPLDFPKALGICWDVSHDMLHISVLDMEEGIVTKTRIASVTPKIYDILGLLAPAIIPAKLILQDLWRLKVGWDDEVPEDIKVRWTAWTSELQHLAHHPITRKLVEEDDSIEFRSLHGFADASQLAYRAAVYIRTIYKDTSTTMALVFSKARVTPLTSMTVPRLELVAAHKLLPYIAKLLNIEISHTE